MLSAVFWHMQWSNDVPQGPGRPMSNVPGPRLYEPAGKRFQLMNAASPTSRSFSWVPACHMALHTLRSGLLHSGIVSLAELTLSMPLHITSRMRQPGQVSLCPMSDRLKLGAKAHITASIMDNHILTHIIQCLLCTDGMGRPHHQ